MNLLKDCPAGYLAASADQIAAWGKQGILNAAAADMAPEIVRIDTARIPELPLKKETVSLFAPNLQPAVAQETASTVMFLVALNSINYRFWQKGEDGTVSRYTHGDLVGALAMRATFEAAWGNTPGPVNLRSQACLTAFIGQAMGDIPALPGRAAILEEVLAADRLENIAQVLLQRIQATQMVSLADARILAEEFPKAYGDRYLKKAQLALSEIASYLGSRGQVVDARLTAFADYQVPRVLRALGVLQYSDRLAEAIDQYALIAENSPEERAIRAATILACESIAAHFEVSSAAVDHFLWSQKETVGATPFHLTETTNY